MTTAATTSEVKTGAILSKFEVTRGSEFNRVAFEVRGPRGAHYGLIRYPKCPSLMYIICLRRFGCIRTISGYSYVREGEDGTLRLADLRYGS